MPIENKAEYDVMLGALIRHVYRAADGNPDMYLHLGYDLLLSLIVNATEVCAWESLSTQLQEKVAHLQEILDAATEEAAVEIMREHGGVSTIPPVS